MQQIRRVCSIGSLLEESCNEFLSSLLFLHRILSTAGCDVWLEKLDYHSKYLWQTEGAADGAVESLLQALRTVAAAVGGIGERGGWGEFAALFGAACERLFDAAAEGRALNFQLVTDDIYAISKGRLIGRPRS